MAEAADIEVKKVENAKPRVMFDTNTYRFIIDGVADNHGNTAETYLQIRQMIIDGKIEAFLSETLFTIEALPKRERLSFMTKYRPNTSAKEKCNGNTVEQEFSIKPDDKHKVDFDDAGPLRDYYQSAISLGFKIIRFPRIGWIMNAEILEKSIYNYYLAEADIYNKKSGEVSDRIEKQGCGMQFVYDLLAPYNGHADNILKKFDYLFKDVNRLPLSARKKRIEEVAKAFAEMSDGDSVASSIGLGCCAFCTNDRAKDAGASSVMSENNVAWLKEEYGFNKVTPAELLEL